MCITHYERQDEVDCREPGNVATLEACHLKLHQKASQRWQKYTQVQKYSSRCIDTPVKKTLVKGDVLTESKKYL